MSIYFVRGRGWRYDFTLKGRRYTEAWFKTKRGATQAEAKRKAAIEKERTNPETQTDMGFLDLVNRRLDHVKAYNSESSYNAYRCVARNWIELWGDCLSCSEITREAVERLVLHRSRVSAFTANAEIRYLRATFNFGMKRKWIRANPTDDLEFLPVERRVRYVPPQPDIDKVIALADAENRDYLWTIRDTMARVSEINQLCWDDVDLDAKLVVLYTRKKKGGHLTPRKVPMTQRVFEILTRKSQDRDPSKPWVFWHRFWSRKAGDWSEGPFTDRKSLMKILAKHI